MLQAGKFRVSVELLKEILGLPKGWNILDIKKENLETEFYVGVAGEGLPEVKENELIPEIEIIFHSDETGKKSIDIIRRT